MKGLRSEKSRPMANRLNPSGQRKHFIFSAGFLLGTRSRLASSNGISLRTTLNNANWCYFILHSELFYRSIQILHFYVMDRDIMLLRLYALFIGSTSMLVQKAVNFVDFEHKIKYIVACMAF